MAIFNIFKKKKTSKKETPKSEKLKKEDKLKKTIQQTKSIIPKEKIKSDKKKKKTTEKKPVSSPKKVTVRAFRILKEPHVSEKATVLTDNNKYVFKVYPNANKNETKKAVEDIYGVRVKNVNIINVHRKMKVLRNIKGYKSGYKKAIVTLEKGEKIEIIPR